MKSGHDNCLLNVTFPFSFSLVNILVNGSVSCWLRVNFSAWGFLSGIALEHEANRNLWLRKGSSSARLNLTSMIPVSGNQDSSTHQGLTSSPLPPWRQHDSCTPAAKHLETPHASALHVQKEQIFLHVGALLLLSVVPRKGSEGNFADKLNLLCD